MHPYITEALMNERVAEMHRKAAADRRAHQARLPRSLTTKTPAPATGVSGLGIPTADVLRRAGLGSLSRSAQAGRYPVHRGGPGLAVAIRHDEDTVANDPELCGSCGER